jgi:hypothetical protein
LTGKWKRERRRGREREGEGERERRRGRDELQISGIVLCVFVCLQFKAKKRLV